MPTERLDAETITQHMKTAVLGRQLTAYDRVRSTQDVALDYGATARDHPDGALFVAEYQTRGRGRFLRQWVAPRGANLLFSVVLLPRARIARPSLLTLGMGIAVADAVSDLAGAPTYLKWPNDVVIGGRKVCGILTEAGLRRERDPFWVVGVGINVNMEASDLPTDLARTATSVRAEIGADIPRAPLLAAVLTRFEKWYGSMQSGESDALLSAARRRMETLGESVAVRLGDHTIEGTAAELDDDGALVVRTALGSRHRITAFEGTLL